jgi:hypothetical protein
LFLATAISRVNREDLLESPYCFKNNNIEDNIEEDNLMLEDVGIIDALGATEDRLQRIARRRDKSLATGI